MRALQYIFFPRVCDACGKSISMNIQHICLQCRFDIPRAHPYAIKENPIEKLFWGRLKIERAISFIRFHKNGKTQRLIHQLKYKGKKEIGNSLGQWAANELMDYGFFQGIDLIVPLPIHKKKYKARGYNQSFNIASGISKATSIPTNTELVYKNLNTESQTNKRKFKRWKNVETSFQLNKDISPEIANLHILLVDDVVTTGATIEACAKTLQEIPKLKLSLLTIACTY